MSETRADNSKLTQQFYRFLAHERHLSGATLKHYGRDIAQLIDLAQDQPLQALDSHQIRRYAAQLHGRGLSGRSVARALSAWRQLFAYLMRDHALKHNPCQGVRAPKSPKRLPAALSPDSAAQLVQLEGDDWRSVRDRAMLELFYSSGLRLSELTTLSVTALDLRDATVTVTGKGSKTRVVPVGQFAAQALRDWLALRASLLTKPSEAVFVNASGKPLSPRTVQQRLAQWAIKRGLGEHVHPHMLRHSFASHVLQSSGDLRAVQEMLGHASISSTQVYTHLDFQHLAKIYDAAHPRARKKVKREG